MCTRINIPQTHIMYFFHGYRLIFYFRVKYTVNLAIYRRRIKANNL